MIHTARTPKGMRNSIILPPVSANLEFAFISGNIPILRYLCRKKSAATEPCLDAGHDVCQVLLGDPVIRLAPVLLALEQATALHEPQVFGGHVAGDATRLGKLPHRVAAL